MIDLFNQLFEKYLVEPANGSTAKSVVKHKLRTVDIASAALMVEVLRADRIVKDEELAAFRKTLADQYHVEGEALDEIMQLAEREVDDATSLYQFTSKITAVMGPKDRAHIIYNMWLLAYADDELHNYEEHLIRKIGALLHVSQADFIEARQKARDKVSF